MPGNKCLNNFDCTSRDCFNGICKGVEKNGYCDEHRDCDVGLRCRKDKNICDLQIVAGENGCLSDFDCSNSAGCMSGACVTYTYIKLSYFSLGKNKTTTSDVFCKSVFMMNGVCLNGPRVTNKDLPYHCIINSTYTEKCIYNFAGSEFKFDCQCGVNSDGDAFCPLPSGEIKYMNYLPTLSDLLKNNCHTLARNNPSQCPDIDRNNLQYQHLEVKFKQYSLHPKLQKNTNCIKETVMSEYYHYFGKSFYLQSYNIKFWIAFLFFLLI